MKKLAFSFLVTLFVTCVLADARDSLIQWWKAEDTNNDGLLQPNELYDMMTVSDQTQLKANEIIQNTASEMARPVSIGTGVLHPSMRKTYDSDTYFSLNNPTNYDSNGTCKINLQSITLPNSSSIAISNNQIEATVIARFKWHGAQIKKCSYISGKWVTNYNYNVTLYANNYNPNYASGWRVGLRCYDGSVNSQMCPTMFIGNGTMYNELHSYGANSGLLRVYKDAWYDYAISVRPSEETGKHKVLFVLRCNRSNGDRMYGSYEFTGTSAPKNLNFATYPSYIGYKGSTTFDNAIGGVETGAGRGEDTFGGDISDIKIYNRALTEREILSEFVDNPVCEIGCQNNNGNEFSDVNAESIYDPKIMPWYKMRKTLNSQYPSVSVKCDVGENEVQLGRLVELKVSTVNIRNKKIEVSLNDKVFGFKTIEPDGWVRFFIYPWLMKSIEKDTDTNRYPFTITFTRKNDFYDDIVIDYLRISGAWQIGKEDNSAQEFGTNDTPFYNYYYNVGQENDKQITTSIGASGVYSFMHLYFPVSKWAASNLTHRLYINGSGNNGTDVFIRLNGSSETNTTIEANTLQNGVSINFEPGSLESYNDLHIFKDQNVSGWNSFDYWRFETIWNGSNYDPNGFLFTIGNNLLLIK